jgi:hypothetical protein
MATFYEPADAETYALLGEIIAEHRTDLLAVGAKITLLFATSDTPGRPAMRHHGFAVAGCARVNPYVDRVEGKGDATITLDGDSWKSRSAARRRALLHHELCHLGTSPGKLDALGRPKLHLKPGDWENDGFDEVVRLYGDDAPEKRWLNSVEERLAQMELPMGAPAPTAEGRRAASKAEFEAGLAGEEDAA